MEQNKRLSLNQLKRLDRLINAYEQHVPHITKKDLADRIGYGYRYVMHMFSGTRPITDAAVGQFAEALGVRQEYLFGHDNIMTETEHKKRMQYAEAYSALLFHAFDNFEYLVIDKNYDFSLLEDEMSEHGINLLQKYLDTGLHAILYNVENDYGNYDYSLIEDMDYINLIRDIRNLIRIKIQQAYEDNRLATLLKWSDSILR